MEINKKLEQDISSYCKLNELDENKYINDLLRNAFMIDKYGNRPPILGYTNKPILDQEPDKECNYTFTISFPDKAEKTIKNKKTPQIPETEAIMIEEKTIVEDKPKKRTRRLAAK